MSFDILYEINEPIIVVDSKLSGVYFNSLALSRFRLSRRVLRGSKSISDIIDFKDFDFTDMVAKTIEKNEIHRTREICVSYSREPKKDMYFIVKCIPHKTDNGDFVILCFKDFTEERSLQEKYGGQVEKIRALELTSLSELASGVAHEINNPLAIVQLWAERAERAFVRSGVELEKNLSFKSVFESIERIRDVVLGLRQIAKTNMGGSEKFDIKKEAHEALMYFTLVNRSVEFVTFHLDFPDQTVLVDGDSMMFQRIILNILTNAKHALNGTPSPEIRVAAKIEGDSIVLSIEDNGCGISQSDQVGLFDRFFTTKKMEFGKGMGLGFIRKSLERLNGTIQLDSEEGVGTTFLITFPVSSVVEESTSHVA